MSSTLTVPSRVFATIVTTGFDEATSTESSSITSKPPPRSSSSSSSSEPAPSSKSSRLSDSGVTRTIPNDSTVTVTRHTTITRELPTTSTDPTASFTTEPTQDATSTSFDTPSPTATSITAPAEQPSGGINTGVVVGIAVGGVFAIALIAALFWLWRSRRNRAVKEVERGHGNESLFIDKASLHDSIFGRRPARPASALLPRHPTPHQASGQGYGYDPFAPFGGRSDRPARTSTPPLPDTFEMDGRGVQVVELPGTAVTTADDAAVVGQRQDKRSARAVKHHPSSDPRATLNHLPRENGRPTYINQWNQYKVLAGETDRR